MSSTLAPNYVIKVNDNEISSDIDQFIKTIEYESIDGMADLLRINAVNPKNIISDSRIFTPGNELSLWIGYFSEELHYVGGAKIYKNRQTFPQEDWPTIEIVGYTKDRDLMLRQPEVSSVDLLEEKEEARRNSQRQPKPATTGKHPAPVEDRTPQKGGRRFRDMKYSDVVLEKANQHGFSTDVDDTHDEPSDFIQKAGLNDYEFIRNLANLSGFYFWIDISEEGWWTLHFRDPKIFNSEQENKIDFSYGEGNSSNLLSITNELLINDISGKIRARAHNSLTGEVLEAEVEETNLESPDPFFNPDSISDKIDGAPQTSSAIDIVIGDFSFIELTNRNFQDQNQLENWVKQWYRRYRDNFIISQGVAIGNPTVMARQFHNITGLGIMYDGEYFFSRVKHKFDAETAGYLLDFSCRKQLPPVE